MADYVCIVLQVFRLFFNKVYFLDIGSEIFVQSINLCVSPKKAVFVESNKFEVLKKYKKKIFSSTKLNSQLALCH